MKIKLTPVENDICSVLGKKNPKLQLNFACKIFAEHGFQKTEDFLKENELDSIFAHVLISEYSNVDYYDTLSTIHHQVESRISIYLKILDQISNKFFEEGIQLIALKNAGIARGIYNCPGCSPMGDIDVLIEKKNFRKAHEILTSEGFQFKFRSELEKEDLDSAERSGGSEYWKLLPNGEKYWFELQWRPVSGRWIRPDQEPDAGELFERSLCIEGTSVRLLSPEDNLLQVCLHTAKHSYVRAPGFRLHLDVERIVNGQQINWGVFLDRVKRFTVKTAVYFSLLIPHDLFQTPIPENVLNELKPSKWKEQIIISMINKAGLFNPNEKKFSKLGYIFFNILLYDDIKGLLSSIIPSKKFMVTKYDIKYDLFIPYFHLKRIFDLIFRRNRV